MKVKQHKIEKEYAILLNNQAYYYVDTITISSPTDPEEDLVPECWDIEALIEKIRNRGYVNATLVEDYQGHLAMERYRHHSLGINSSITFTIMAWASFQNSWKCGKELLAVNG